MPPRSPPWKHKHSQTESASYLASLRNDRPTRPTGSRPPPFKTGSFVASIHASLSRSDSAPSIGAHDGPESQRPSQIVHSNSFSSNLSHKGRPLVHGPLPSVSSLKGRNISPTVSIQSLDSVDREYQESTQRKLEKEEAHTLREALALIDGQDEESRIYTAAQAEAADLVWKHLNPQAAEAEKTAPYINPDATRKSYGAQLGNDGRRDTRNASDGSNTSTSSTSRSTQPRDRALSSALKDLHLASEQRSAEIVSMAKSGRRRSSGIRNASNGSNKSIFRNPEDQIYEEPELIDPAGNASNQATLPLRSRDRNSILRGSRPLPEKPGVTFAPQQPRHNRVEIHKNPPSQSRNAAYTNSVSHARHQSIDEAEEEPRRSVDGIEIRSDDIRAATGFKLKDRSAKLPTPSAVSDQLGRPIVSFDPTWRPSGDSPRNSHDMARPVIKFTESPRTSKDMQRPLPRPLPSTSEAINTAPVVPTINLPGDDDVPSIQVDDCDGASISVTAPEIAVTAPTAPTYSIFPPVETKSAPKPPARPLPVHAATAPVRTSPSKRLPWLNRGLPGVPSVSCSSCALPISGRVVTASGSATTSLKARFHPECFACHHCQANLECIAFFPEPDAKRAERLEAKGIAEGSEEADVRFYCSLDYAEMFAPRCKSCKTPIEGEVIVAAGAEWHVGHFFCAECGDPFDSNTPFVEKDGYAYCVRCHTKRTSARCRECKQQILEEVTVEALGGKWHESCFKCFECEGDFGDGGRFFVRDVSVEPTDKEKRKGIMAKMEEKAVCEGCEERRLKA
jgi:hypothetical protein